MSVGANNWFDTIAGTSELISKFNSNHDSSNGRFSSSSGNGGISRSGNAKDGFTYSQHGKPLDAASMERVKSLKIRPDLRDVMISPDLHSELQAIGKDSKGRSQYIYTKEHDAKMAAVKYQRLEAFNKMIPQIHQKLLEDMSMGNAATSEKASAIYLIMKTGFRIGGSGDTGAKVPAHGATTLKKEHISVNGDNVKFDFIGKKGVRIQQEVNDPQLAFMMSGRLSKLKPGENIFKTNDVQVREYVHNIAGKDFKPKDFRTWTATSTALKEIESMAPPKTKTEFVTSQKKVAEVVSKKLGNTPKIAMEAYISPTVWGYWTPGAQGWTK